MVFDTLPYRGPGPLSEGMILLIIKNKHFGGGEFFFEKNEWANRVTLQHIDAWSGYLRIVWRDALATTTN